MNISIGADHAGFEMKQHLVEFMPTLGHSVTDVGTHDPGKPDDYPDCAVLVAHQIREGKAGRGVLVCGSGVGVSVAANKFKDGRLSWCALHQRGTARSKT